MLLRVRDLGYLPTATPDAQIAALVRLRVTWVKTDIFAQALKKLPNLPIRLQIKRQ